MTHLDAEAICLDSFIYIVFLGYIEIGGFLKLFSNGYICTKNDNSKPGALNIFLLLKMISLFVRIKFFRFFYFDFPFLF